MHPDTKPASTAIRRLLSISPVHLTGGLLMLLACATAQADLDDHTKPINIKADESEFDQRTGVQTFRGNVEVTQGSMEIRADSIEIAFKDGVFYRITGTGTPVQFQQIGANNELARGQSEKIVFDTVSMQLTFEGGASFERPGQKFSGGTINYNLRNLKFSATGGGTKERVNIVLQPGSLKKDQ